MYAALHEVRAILSGINGFCGDHGHAQRASAVQMRRSFQGAGGDDQMIYAAIVFGVALVIGYLIMRKVDVWK